MEKLEIQSNSTARHMIFCTIPCKESKWHLHNAKECGDKYKKCKSKRESNNNSTSDKPNQIVLDQKKLKKGMSAQFPDGDFDIKGPSLLSCCITPRMTNTTSDPLAAH
jgi:hypothetical protein